MDGQHSQAPVVVIHAAGVSARKVRKIVREELASFADTIINALGGLIMANMADLTAALSTLQAGQTTTLTDLAELIRQGDTATALETVDNLIAVNTQMDEAIKAATAPAAPSADGGVSAPIGE